MVRLESNTAVILALCASLCLAGRENRLAYKDDLERMLKDLADSSSKEQKKDAVDSANPNSSPKEDSKVDAPTKPLTPILGGSPGTDNDILDQISQVIEEYRRKKKKKSQPEDDSSQATAQHNTSTSTAPPTWRQHAKHKQEAKNIDSPSKNTGEREKLLKDLLTILQKFSEDKSTPLSTICTTAPTTTTESPSPTTTPDKIEEIKVLKEEALEVAARAAKLYLHLARV